LVPENLNVIAAGRGEEKGRVNDHVVDESTVCWRLHDAYRPKGSPGFSQVRVAPRHLYLSVDLFEDADQHGYHDEPHLERELQNTDVVEDPDEGRLAIEYRLVESITR
jgi:hypothetical protein